MVLVGLFWGRKSVHPQPLLQLPMAVGCLQEQSCGLASFPTGVTGPGCWMWNTRFALSSWSSRFRGDQQRCLLQCIWRTHFGCRPAISRAGDSCNVMQRRKRWLSPHAMLLRLDRSWKAGCLVCCQARLCYVVCALTDENESILWAPMPQYGA